MLDDEKFKNFDSVSESEFDKDVIPPKVEVDPSKLIIDSSGSISRSYLKTSALINSSKFEDFHSVVYLY